MYRPFSACLLLLLATPPATPQEKPETPPDASELKQLIEELRQNQVQQSHQYEERIRSLETLLKKLQSDRQQQREEDELDELLRLAESSGPPPAARPSANPSLLNPQISVIPDFVGRVHDVSIKGDAAAIEAAFPELFTEQNALDLREVEVDMRAPVSPDADAVAILAVGEEEVAFEEVYITFHSLPWGLAAKVGKFLIDFGSANRIHQHDLPQTDRPIVHRLLFGDEGTSSPGVSLSKLLFTTEAGGLLPALSELTVEVISSINEESPLLGTEAHNQIGVNTHWRNFWQLTPNADLEGGVSFLASPDGPAGRHEQTTALGGDLTWRWRDPEPGSYNSWLVQGEVIGSSVDVLESSSGVNALGGYLTVQKQFDPNWYGGLRLDAAQSPVVEDANIFGVAPYVTHYLNEFIRLRLQYSYMSGEVEDGSAVNQGLSAQLTWVFGAHPPEPYWVNR